MKHSLVILTILTTISFHSYSQTETQPVVSFNGFYIAKTGSVPAANIEIFTYLLFYEDGTVYLQSVSANDPQSVAKWFGRDKKFSQKGTYIIDGSGIVVNLTNKDTEDAKLEGIVETSFKGSIKPNNQLCLVRDKETEEKCFVFSKIP
ncbi:MAG: hypothetical protein JNM19_06165 [Chitinophagaceae bacterium]|nr:hypothetical protein [Chitinophagaceae bacterium]